MTEIFLSNHEQIKKWKRRVEQLSMMKEAYAQVIYVLMKRADPEAMSVCVNEDELANVDFRNLEVISMSADEDREFILSFQEKVKLIQSDEDQAS